MNRRFIGFWLVMALCSTAISSPRQLPHPGPAQTARTGHDLDSPLAKASKSDGEPLRGLSSRFSVLDVNHDGYLSRTELQADPKLASRFNALDANHDGKLSKLEFSQIVALSVMSVPFPWFGGAGGGGQSD